MGGIPYDATSWIALAWCRFCGVGFGELSNRDYGWSDALVFRYDSNKLSYRVSLHNGVRLNVERLEANLNTIIEADPHGKPIGLAPEARQMKIEDVPIPPELPASLWDGWMTGFEPGVLSAKRKWRQ